MVVFLVPIKAEETGSPEKYIITNDDTGEEIGRFGRFDETFLAVGKLGKGKYTVTLYEDDLDMGSWGGISYGHQVTLKSSNDGPFTIYNRRESNKTNTQRHFSQVAGDLIT